MDLSMLRLVPLPARSLRSFPRPYLLNGWGGRMSVDISMPVSQTIELTIGCLVSRRSRQPCGTERQPVSPPRNLRYSHTTVPWSAGSDLLQAHATSRLTCENKRFKRTASDTLRLGFCSAPFISCRESPSRRRFDRANRSLLSRGTDCTDFADCRAACCPWFKPAALPTSYAGRLSSARYLMLRRNDCGRPAVCPVAPLSDCSVWLLRCSSRPWESLFRRRRDALMVGGDNPEG
jgi:hypothetical protein